MKWYKKIERLIKKTGWLTPNFLTTLRLILSFPVFILTILYQYKIALIIFIIAVFTDFLDGFIARIKNLTSEKGTIFDALVDKFLIVPIFIVLTLRYLSQFLVVLIIISEMLHIFGGLWILVLRKSIKKKIKANIWGKLKMIFQTLGIVFLFTVPLNPLIMTTFYLAISASFLSLLIHLINILKTA